MLPETVKVAGINYTVAQVPVISDDPGNMGDIMYQKSTIRIKQDMSEDKKQQTLIHELLHACFYEAGIHDQDEDMIDRVGVVLHQVLRDNKQLLG